MADHPHASGDASDEDWLYHLPAFLDQVRERDAHGIVENLDDDADVDGVLYHHRGARVPGYNATFIWNGRGREDADEDGSESTFELEIDTVGPRSAWAVFDADRSWDFYLSRAPGDEPCLAWMTDAEFDREEASEYASKQEAIGAGRFSFGLYLHSPATWETLHEKARDSTAPFFIHRPSGRTLMPDVGGDLDAYADALPVELDPDDAEEPPGYLGLVDAHVSHA